MSLNGFFVRFAGVYLGSLLGGELLFHLANGKPPAWLGFATLFGAVVGVCIWFSGANGRYFAPSEKRQIILGIWLLTLVGDVLVLLGRGWAGGIGPKGMLSVMFGSMLGVFVFVALVQLANIWIAVWIAGKLRTVQWMHSDAEEV